MSNLEPGDLPEPLDWRMYYVAEQTETNPRGGQINRLGEIDEFNKATFVLRLNDVGSFLIDGDPQAGGLMDAVQAVYPDRARHVELVINGRRVFLGPIQGLERALDNTGERVSVFGNDQNVWLAQRVCLPTLLDPLNRYAYPTTGEDILWVGQAPPNCGAWMQNAGDRRDNDLYTGPAAQAIGWYVSRNLGTQANPNRRRIDTTVAQPAAGNPVVMSARFQNLLEFAQGIAVQGGDTFPLGFTIDAWALRTWVPADTGAVFSPQIGNIRSYLARDTVDDLNLAYVAGQGEGSYRMIATNYGYGINQTPPAPPVFPGLPPAPLYGRVEAFRDRRDTQDWTQLVAAAVEDCRTGIRRPTVTVAALDTATQRYGRDYDLGDVVTVRFQGQEIKVLVTALTFTLEPGRAPTVTPTLGTETAVAPLGFVNRLNQAGSRLTQLERR